MTNLSSLTGFGSGGSGGGGGSTYDGTFFLDAKNFNLQDDNKYLEVTNMDSYFQTIRVRGMDDANHAYFGTNCMVQNGQGGNMQHLFSLFRADQTTGAIEKVNTRVMHNNNGSTSDYSTFNKTADEWTGRYSYHGHIPCNGQGHNYSYHCCFAYDVSGGNKDSTHNSRNSYMPAGNDQTHSAYVAPSERQLGGATKQVLSAYDGSSKACLLEYDYGQHSSSTNMQKTDSVPFGTSITSTNYQVANFNQWDATTEPYYDCLHSFKEGLYARRRSDSSWSNLGSQYGISSRWYNFFLSNGNMLFGNGSSMYLVDTTGNVSAAPAASNPMAIVIYSWMTSAWCVGEDEWLQSIPGGKFLKFKINPSTGAVTVSNALEVRDISNASYDSNYSYTNGFWSRFSTTSVNNGGFLATFGTENSNGYGYGQSKLIYCGGKSSPSAIHLATYDIADLVSTLAYPS